MPQHAYSLLDPQVLRNPYPLYKQMREEDPIHFSSHANFWVLTRYRDVVDILKNPLISSDRKKWLNTRSLGVNLEPLRAFRRTSESSMLWMDPPKHMRVRSVAQQGFTRQALAGWKTIIAGVVNELLDRIQDRGRMDIVTDLAQPLPAIVIARIFDVPPEDREHFQTWANDYTQFLARPVKGNLEEVARKSNAAAIKLDAYFTDLIDERNKRPGKDIVSLLLAGYEAGCYDRDELVSLCILIMNAGHVTTIDQLANGVYQLLRHPTEFRKLQGNPELIPSAAEEMFRYDTSVPFTFRFATEDVDVSGKTIPQGSVLALGLAAANRDPQQFASPEVFDITRQNNKHVAFAHGSHHCLGATLARMELAIALEALCRRMPGLRLNEEHMPVIKAETLIFKGFHMLPVEF